MTLLAATDLCPQDSPAQKTVFQPAPAFQAVATPLAALEAALSRLASNVTRSKPACAQLATQGGKLVQAATALGGHPIVRISLAIEAMLQDCAGSSGELPQAQIQTLLRATDLISSLLDPSNQDQGKALPAPQGARGG